MKEILKNRPNGPMIDAARAESKKLIAHITGKDSEDLLCMISGLENDDQLKLRRKYARSNKDMFARIHRPEDKIFSAKGGSTYFNMSDAQKKQFVLQLQDVYNGYSSRSWTEYYAKQYYHLDPMGLIFIEIGYEIAYPTYKSTSSIYDYKLKGRQAEYIIFTTDKADVFRIVDDQFDYLVQWKDQVLTKIQEQTYPNYFGKVPALIISDILGQNCEQYTSPDWEIIEIADEFLRECSVKSIYKLKHGFPKAWQYASSCNACKGTGLLNGNTCSACNGSGRSVSKDSSEVITLPIPVEGQPTIAPTIAGYVSPDIQGWDKMTDELSMLESLMQQTYWGVDQMPRTQGASQSQEGAKTATEVITDTQPMNDRLTKFSKWGEGVETFITNMLGDFYYNSSFKGSSINYGRRYQMEGPDVLWNKYEDARSKGSPMAVLDELLIEYYYSKFATNSLELNKYLKLMKVEPFVHLSMGEAKNSVSDFIDYNRKLYFSEWLNQLPDNEVLIKQVADLVKSLADYVDAKGIKEPEPVIKPIN